MKLNYDIRGNLYPPDIVQIEWADFVENFETKFTDSTTRCRLLNNFVSFLNSIQENFQTDFKVWIDGSFVSKKNNPRDIDAVFLLDYKICERYKSVLDNSYFIKELKFTKGLDLIKNGRINKTDKFGQHRRCFGTNPKSQLHD